MNWVASWATDTRLMGVVVVKTRIRDDRGHDRYLFYHLDFETYGVDGVELTGQDEQDFVGDQIHGGLGGSLVKISAGEADELIRQAWRIGVENVEEERLALLEFHSFAKPLTPAEKEDLYRKICVTPRSPEELLNYFLMRWVGDDLEMIRWMTPADLPMRYPKNCTLVRSKVVPQEEGFCLVSATVLAASQYTMDRFLIGIGERGIEKVDHIDHLLISPIEAAMQLRRPERIRVYGIGDLEGFRQKMYRRLRRKMMVTYGPHVLFTVFHPHNDHVNASVYRLDGDVEVMCYLTDESQLLLVAEEESTLIRYESLVKSLSDGYNVEILGSFGFSHQILADFIASEAGDFLEFASEEIDEW